MAVGSRPFCPPQMANSDVRSSTSDWPTFYRPLQPLLCQPLIRTSSAVDALSVAAMSSTTSSTSTAAAAGAPFAAAASPRSSAFYKAKPRRQHCGFVAASATLRCPPMWMVLKLFRRRQCKLMLTSGAENVDFNRIVDQTYNRALPEKDCRLVCHCHVLFGLR